MHPRTLTYSVDHTVPESRVKVQRLEPCRELEIFSEKENYKIRVEISNI